MKHRLPYLTSTAPQQHCAAAQPNPYLFSAFSIAYTGYRAKKMAKRKWNFSPPSNIAPNAAQTEE